MSLSSAVRVADATAASSEAPGAGASFARNAGYRPVTALTASKTDTCPMPIILTATGGEGCRDAMAAAFSFASVTTSARAHEVPASVSATARQSARWIGLQVMIFISSPPRPVPRFGDLVVHVQPEGEAPRAAAPGAPPDRGL